MIFGIENYNRPTRRARLWNWLKKNKVYVITQGAFLAVAPVVLVLGWIMRGYVAFGAEIFLILAPSIYKAFMWADHYDD